MVLGLLYYKLRIRSLMTMDFGQDAALSAMYAREHEDVLHLLQQQKTNLRADKKGPLAFPTSELRNHGFYPSSLAQTGVTWRKLVRKHGLQALLDYGMDWRNMVACGFCAPDLGMLTYADAQRLQLTSSDLLEVRPTLADISGMCLSPHEFEALGLADWKTFRVGLGADAVAMRDMKYTLEEWKNILGANTPWRELGFTETNRCGWKKKDVAQLLNLQHKSTASAPVAAATLQRGSLVF